jgi:hypothetical protein
MTEMTSDPKRMGWRGTKYEGKPRPYIYATWLTKLIAGESKCWYASWYKANHKYEKRPDDPGREDFFAEWTKKHDAIVARRVEELRKQDYVVKVEEEGEFKLEGVTCDVAGKPDYVAMKDGVALVGDAKSGKKRESDHWQVLIYMFALPLSWLKGTKYVVDGEVKYTDQVQPVRPLNEANRKRITEAIKKLASPEAPEAAPSIGECKFCDVAKCTFRKESERKPDGDATSFF